MHILHDRLGLLLANIAVCVGVAIILISLAVLFLNLSGRVYDSGVQDGRIAERIALGVVEYRVNPTNGITYLYTNHYQITVSN